MRSTRHSAGGPDDLHPIPGSERRSSPTARRLGPADPTELLTVTITLRRRPDGPPPPDFDHFATVHSAQRQRLSEDEFARQYGASPDDIDKVRAFATNSGLRVVETHAARRTVVVRGTVAQMNAAFGVDLGRYEHEVRPHRRAPAHRETYRGREGVVHVPASLAGIVIGVFGLDNRRISKRASADPPNTVTVTVPQVTKLYNFPTNSAAGQTIAIFSEAGYQSSDISTTFGGSPPTITDISVDASNDGSADPETTQDICIAGLAAPGAAIAVYFTTYDQKGWVDLISRWVLPNAGDPHCSVLSSSFYVSNGDDTDELMNEGVSVSWLNAVDMALQDAAVQGVTFVTVSGDYGVDTTSYGGGASDGKQHVVYPGSDPWALCCGGTTIGNIMGSSFDEYVWNDVFTSGGASINVATGGGVSDFFGLPSYQSNANIPRSLKDDHVGRGVPDVAANASPNSGYQITIGGAAGIGDGTSAAAPLWAGLIAVMNAALGINLGFVNPALYALGSGYFRDIVPGGGPKDNGINGVPGYPAGPGWDACTGWGSPDGQLLLAGLRSIYTRSLYFIVDKNTFGVDEVTDVIAQGGGLYSNAFWLVLEGFSISQLGSVVPTLGGAFKGLTGVSVFMDAAGPSYEDPTDLYTPQRIRFPYDIIFSSTALSADFPAAGTGPNFELLTASLTVGGGIVAAETEFELVAGADPYFTNIDPVTRQVFYLSQDLRVFSVAAGQAPLPGAPTATSDGYQTIQSLLGFLNSTSTYTTPGPDPLNALPGQTGYETGDSSVTPLTGGGQQNYNFAIARVRLQGAAGDAAANVRVFFRLFVAQSCDTDFQPTTTYLSQLGTGAEAGLPVFPLPSGTGLTDPYGQSIQTVPFFATDSGGTHDYDGSNPNANIRTVTIPLGQDKLWAYFGCYLDVYNAAHQSIFPGTHHCIVAQIAYDETPLQNSGGVTLSPENTDKLAQRNLQITSSGNPGFPDTHRVPQAFDTRASLPTGGAKGQLQDYPDELMIDWGSVPAGSTARIYWPQANAATVIDLAAKLYGVPRLRADDAHTIALTTTRGVSYVPIPFDPGAAKFAGLFTLDLPSIVRTGEELNVQVRRVTSRQLRQVVGTVAAPAGGSGGVNPLAERGGFMRNWRYVTGTFQVKIPVGDDKELLLPEENTLAILKWRLEQYSPLYRWRPVLQRYIEYVGGRVRGFGGDPGAIKPSPIGVPLPGHVPPPRGEAETWTGKVSAVVYDRFGDFEGFDLETEHGRERRFHATEHAIEDLVRGAWLDRVLIAVHTPAQEPHRPTSIRLLRGPRPHPH
jgi:Pro-kumamolisin, activation domain